MIMIRVGHEASTLQIIIFVRQKTPVLLSAASRTKHYMYYFIFLTRHLAPRDAEFWGLVFSAPVHLYR